MEDIPGGPKLPRTPQGPMSVGARSGARTPAPSPQDTAADSPRISFAPGSQASIPSTAQSPCIATLDTFHYLVDTLSCTLFGLLAWCL